MDTEEIGGNLTAKQEAFAQAVVNGGMNQSEAYRSVYDVSEDANPKTIHEEASKVANNRKVATRIKQLKLANEELNAWSRLDSINALKSVVDNPDKAGDIINAVKELNAMHGYNAATKFDINASIGVRTLDDFYGES